jgi:hypothetical protein
MIDSIYFCQPPFPALIVTLSVLLKSVFTFQNVLFSYWEYIYSMLTEL